MTKDDLLQELRALVDADGENPESEHVAADHALLAYIDDPEVTELYNQVHKWYS